MPCGKCGIEGHKSNSKDFHPKPKIDTFTSLMVLALYKAFIADETAIEDIESDCPGLHIRKHGMRMELSENAAKFAIQNKLNDPSCTWACEVGDLYSKRFGRIEVKSLTSVAPTSYGSDQPWDTMVVVDAIDWKKNIFKMYLIPLSNTDPFWLNLPVNKNETKGDQSQDKRRPRASWINIIKPLLEKQFPNMAVPFYEGTFDGIFIPVVKEVVAEQSVVLPEPTQHSLPVCTDENQPMQESCTPPEIPEN